MSAFVPIDMTDDEPSDLHRRIVKLLWLMAGGIYIVFTGRVFGLASVALLFPGILIAGLLAQLGWIVCAALLWMRNTIGRTCGPLAGRCTGMIGSAWVVTMLAGPVYLAVVFIRIVRAVFHMP